MVLPLLLALFAAPPPTGQQVSASLRSGDAITTLKLAQTVLKLRNGRKAVDRILKNYRLPPFEKIVLNSRLAIAAQGLSKQAPRPDYREMQILMGPLVAHLDSEYRAITRHRLLKNQLSLPNKLDGFTGLLWDHYTLQNRVGQLEREAQYYAQLAKRFPKSQLKKLDRAVVRLLDVKYVDRVLLLVKRVAVEREEREMETRLARLRISRMTLARKKLNTERILAAGTWRIDSHNLVAFLKKPKPTREALADPGLGKEVRAAASEAGRLAGSLTLRAETLFQMLFWWSRGRYGIGTHENGLAKHPMSFRNQALMVQVMMPSQRPVPKPFKPAKKSLSQSRTKEKAEKPKNAEDPMPLYDRRHHYWWSIGQRELTESSTQFGKPVMRTVAQRKTVFM